MAKGIFMSPMMGKPGYRIIGPSQFTAVHAK
jgi:hypothetical protein